jgi:hypothetical protein
MQRGSDYRKGAVLSLLGLLSICGETPAAAQMTTGFRPVEEPGIYGVRIHPGALAPNRRKWYLPQNLYQEYRWKGWEYSNYARDRYERYVDIVLEGRQHYDLFGNYISRGFSIYDWTENAPQRQGSSIFKSPNFSGWFNRIVVSSAQKGQFYTAVTIGDAIRTSMTPLTFSKPAFNGVQWDFLGDKYAVTLLASRINSPGIIANSQSAPPSKLENSTRLVGTRGVVQVGDFAQVGATWINASHARSDLGMSGNSLKGVLTTPQNTGNVETVTIRISDDSPETPGSGALLIFDRVIIDGEIHPEITPIVRGGIRQGGNIEARGEDVVELIYDIRNAFRPTEEVPTTQDARKLEFDLIIANDYRVEISSNMQTDRLGDQVFLPVAQARDEITDGSNQRFLRFEYGLPTGHEVLGVDFKVMSLAGLDLRAEYVINRRFRRFPNQNFEDLDVVTERAEAAYITASYEGYPWFAYGEAFTMDPDYSTTAFIGNSLGTIDYSDETRHFYEFVDDNDDQDRFSDWFRAGELGVGGGVAAGSSGEDIEVFPGLDENNDFISDFNQNRNTRPDYAEPFLRYTVDAPEFLFGMDMNNNTLIDRFEDDRQPDYPYDRDHRGFNLYGGLMFTEQMRLTLGHLSEIQLSSARRSRATYALFTANWRYPGLNFSFFGHSKFVKDDIPEDRVVWVDPIGMTDFQDPLDLQDTVVNSLYFQAHHFRVANLNVSGKVKYERFVQRGDQRDGKRDRSFLGVINKVDYTLKLREDLVFTPKWKSTFRRQVPTRRGLSTSRDLEETLFLITRYLLLPQSWIDVGFEFSFFENLKKRPRVPQLGFVDDFNSRIFAIMFSNTSAYLGYRLTMNAGLQREHRVLQHDTINSSTAFIRVFAATGSL